MSTAEKILTIDQQGSMYDIDQSFNGPWPQKIINGYTCSIIPKGFTMFFSDKIARPSLPIWTTTLDIAEMYALKSNSDLYSMTTEHDLTLFNILDPNNIDLIRQKFDYAQTATEKPAMAQARLQKMFSALCSCGKGMTWDTKNNVLFGGAIRSGHFVDPNGETVLFTDGKAIFGPGAEHMNRVNDLQCDAELVDAIRSVISCDGYFCPMSPSLFGPRGASHHEICIFCPIYTCTTTFMSHAPEFVPEKKRTIYKTGSSQASAGANAVSSLPPHRPDFNKIVTTRKMNKRVFKNLVTKY